MVGHSTRVREQLDALPDIPLPDTLWQRVEARRMHKVRRWKWGMGGATLVLVALMATPLLTPVFTGTGMERGRSAVALKPTPALRDIQAEVRALDHALQAAYDRGASDAEIAPMWVARHALLAGAQSGAAAKPDRT